MWEHWSDQKISQHVPGQQAIYPSQRKDLLKPLSQHSLLHIMG